MPVITLCQNGWSMGKAPRNNDHPRGKRGVAQGWTRSATRSNRKFLWSVRCPDLGVDGWSFTLTLRECPKTSADWARLRRAFQKRMERCGAVRMHWLTEWQRRGVPHLHGCIWFPPEHNPHDSTTVLHHWAEVASDYGVRRQAQDCKPITGALGWLQYLAKHADRGIYNYQRASGSIPEGWKESTGRMWGHTGAWPLTEPQKLVVDDAGYNILRRISQRWRLANARAERDPAKRAARIRSARRSLQANKRTLCSVRGVAEWLPRPAQRQALLYVASLGCEFFWAAEEQPEQPPEPE